MLPPGVSAQVFNAALAAFTEAVGKDNVYTADEDVALYRDAYDLQWGLPGERHVSAAVAPGSVEEVQKVVIAANKHRIPIYPIATGMNLGYGGSAPNLSGSVVLDLKRMDKVIEVDDKRHFAILEPGVSYFDLYRYIQDRHLKVWIDCPDPGWGSPVGNSLDHGVGYTYMGYRDHFYSHCGMEIVLPNGELLRTGMGALPAAKTWGEYHYGVGPYVDGLFSQSNMGVVTKMGFHLLPAPEAYRSGLVLAPRRQDLIALVTEINALEHAGLIGQPGYGSPLRAVMREPAVRSVFEKPGGPTDQEFDGVASDHKLAAWSCELQFYGAPAVIDAGWNYAKERLAAVIPGAVFQDQEYYRLPLSHEQQLKVPHKPSVGIPNLELFRSRTPINPNPSEGHAWFSPVIPKSGESILEAQRVLGDASQGMKATSGLPAYGPLSTPSTWMYRAFVLISGFPISRSNPEQNKSVHATLQRLVEVAAEHGWGEYRTPPALQEAVVNTYSFNNHAMRRFHETLKDAIDPNGIISAGRYGIWPKHLRHA
jgi:(+)-pinoresinol hydroxylase